MLREEVTPEEIAEVVSKWTGIPVSKLMEGQKEKLLSMEKRLAERVIGQELAVQVVSAAVRRARSGLQDPNRPIGSFIFLGPTGVGKTETARALAEFLFDDDDAMIRIDMSRVHGEARRLAAHRRAPRATWATRRAASSPRRCGAAPTRWCSSTRSRRPTATSSTCFLQILDDGRLTDGQGRTVDFRNAVLIMTSNVGSEHIMRLGARKDSGQGDARGGHGGAARRVQAGVPEPRRRRGGLPAALPRGPLATSSRSSSAGCASCSPRSRSPSSSARRAREAIADAGYDPVYGARPLKRAIQRMIQDPLATKLLSGEFVPGDHIVVDEGKDGGLEFRKGTRPRRPEEGGEEEGEVTGTAKGSSAGP